MKVKEISKIVADIKIMGNGDIEFTGLNLCNRPSQKNEILSYAVNSNYAEDVTAAKYIVALITNKASCHAYEDSMFLRGGALIISEQPEKTFYVIHEYLCKKSDFYGNYNFTAQIGNGCRIHKNAVIEDGVIIGNNVTIGAMTVVKQGTIIDNNVTIGCCSVIASEGFQLISIPGEEPMHITHVGKCHICDDVYIGDNTCVANSLFEGETYIGKGTKIDNLVHIPHNCYIGENVVIAAGAVLCGSSIIEDNVWLAPNVSVLNRVTIGKNSTVGLGSVVTRDVCEGTLVYGAPAKQHQKGI